MTQQQKKHLERAFATECAIMLEECWSFQGDDRESPDFIVEVDGITFGLEVVQCFIGQTNKGGSKLREKEEANNNWLDKIRAEFCHKDMALHLRYLGQPSPTSRQELLDLLHSDAWEGRLLGYRGRWKLATATVYITVANVSHWECISDRVGWINDDGAYVQACIDKKARKLGKYQKANQDSRLLVVADSLYNSGKLILPDDFVPDFKGFAMVYFYTHPAEVRVFHSS
jgi:hypothetical protein